MSSKPNKLAVGQWWRRRDGVEVHIVKNDGSSYYPFLSESDPDKPAASGSAWHRPDGTHAGDESAFDLVEYLGTERSDQPTEASRSDGSTANYYELPDGANELQDLISYRNMNAQDGEIFRAIYRKGRASHSDELRDAKKVLFYAQKEVERLEQFRSDKR